MQPIDLFVTEYARFLMGKGQSKYTLKNVRYALKKFTGFLEESGIQRIEDINQELIEEYQQALCYDVGKTGRSLALRTQGNLLSVVKGFTRYLKDRHCFVTDPGENVLLPKKPKRLPRTILTKREVRKILVAPDMQTKSGYRDRVILEILYDTAIRRGEVSAIQIKHIDLDDGYIHVHGKGNKQRVVPVSRRVCELIENYLKFVRTEFLKGSDDGFLILNRFGSRMDPNGIWAVVKRHAEKAGTNKNVSTHTFRHHAEYRIMPTSFDSFSHLFVISAYILFIPLV